MKRDHEHGLPPESRRQSAQLENVEREIMPFLGVIAAAVLIMLGASLVSRTPSAPRVTSAPVLDLPR